MTCPDTQSRLPTLILRGKAGGFVFVNVLDESLDAGLCPT